MTLHESHHDTDSKNFGFKIIQITAAVLCFAGGFVYAPLFIAAYVISGVNIILKAIKNIIHGQFFDENFLMFIATIGAICIKEYPEAAAVMILFQIGEFLQDKAIEKSRESITELINLKPDFAIIEGKKIQPQFVHIGDIITVNTGEKIPLDGIVIGGNATIDTSALTGESIPCTVSENDEVLSGSINLDGYLKIRVTKGFEESTATKILKLVEDAAEKKAPTENFISKFARYYTPAVVILAFLIAYIMPIFFDGNWLERALTFLVISCPCALVISIPLTFFAGIGHASSKGILIKGSNYIETLSKIDSAVFDKTGTLTQGLWDISEIHSENPDLLKFAAHAEIASSHPVANIIKNAYGKPLGEVTNIKEFSGKGVEAEFEGTKIRLGKADFIGVQEAKNKTGTIVYISLDGIYAGYIVISDRIKPQTKSVIQSLKKMKIQTYMLTGDTEQNAQNIKEICDIDYYYSNLLPQDKLSILEKIISNSKGKVLYTGDGINDAPSLMRADVGAAMGALGCDSAIEAADIVIMDDNPQKLVESILISKICMKIVLQNITCVLLIKFTFLALAGVGIATMWSAVFADVGVTILAIINSLRVRK